MRWGPMARSFALIAALFVFLPAAGHGFQRANSSSGRFTATIIQIGSGAEDGTGSEALILGDTVTGRERRLLTSQYNDDFHLNLTGLANPLFSLDGGYVYFSSSDASPNRNAVHQVSLRSGVVRFIVNGFALKLIRTGPYRGYLLVQTHRYYDRPQGGSYNPVFVIRPDGHVEIMVPGSANDDGELAVEPWLARHGWHAW